METDICAVNHGGNPESVAAFQGIVPTLPALRKKVLFAVSEMKFATVKEVVDRTGLARLTVGARLTELKKSGLLTATNTIREGCRVLTLSEQGKKVIQTA